MIACADHWPFERNILTEPWQRLTCCPCCARTSSRVRCYHHCPQAAGYRPVIEMGWLGPGPHSVRVLTWVGSQLPFSLFRCRVWRRVQDAFSKRNNNTRLQMLRTRSGLWEQVLVLLHWLSWYVIYGMSVRIRSALCPRPGCSTMKENPRHAKAAPVASARLCLMWA